MEDDKGGSTGKDQGKVIINDKGTVKIEKGADIIDSGGKIVGDTKYRQVPDEHTPSKPNSN